MSLRILGFQHEQEIKQARVQIRTMSIPAASCPPPSWNTPTSQGRSNQHIFSHRVVPSRRLTPPHLARVLKKSPCTPFLGGGGTPNPLEGGPPPAPSAALRSPAAGYWAMHFGADQAQGVLGHRRPGPELPTGAPSPPWSRRAHPPGGGAHRPALRARRAGAGAVLTPEGTPPASQLRVSCHQLPAGLAADSTPVRNPLAGAAADDELAVLP